MQRSDFWVSFYSKIENLYKYIAQYAKNEGGYRKEVYG